MSVAESDIRLVALAGYGGHTAVLEDARVLLNEEIAPGHFLLRLIAPRIAAVARPGQFAMLSLVRDGESLPVLPRPMALWDWDSANGTVDVVYRIVGKGTTIMRGFHPGETLVTVGPLGQSFTLRPDTRRLLLLGRGIGVCSLTALGRRASARGLELEVVVSARGPKALIGLEFFQTLGAQVWSVHDEDGSSEVSQLERLLRRQFESAPAQQIAVCGSERLLSLAGRLAREHGSSVEVSLEAHMACGMGYCHGCASGRRELADESPLICKDGPVFAVQLTP